MPISDYYVSNTGYLDAFVLDFYSNLLVIIEPTAFHIKKLNGNSLHLGTSYFTDRYSSHTLSPSLTEAGDQEAGEVEGSELDVIKDETFTIFI